MSFSPRRFITNFVDGTAEFHDSDVPPAQEYLSLNEHEAMVAVLLESLDLIATQAYRGNQPLSIGIATRALKAYQGMK